MKIRTLGTALASAALVTSLLAGTAFAETTPPPAPAPAPAPAPDWLSTLQAQAATIMQLRTQTSALEKQANTVAQTNKDLLRQLQTNAAKDLIAQLKTLKEQLKQAEATTVAPLRDQIKPLETQLKQAKANKDEAQALVLRAKINDLRSQVKAAWAALQPQRDQIKALTAQLKTKEASVKAVRVQLQPLWAQEKAVWTKTHEINAARRDAWKAFESALAANNHDGMITALNNIVTQQQALVANLQQIIDLRQQVSKLLNDALSAQATSN